MLEAAKNLIKPAADIAKKCLPEVVAIAGLVGFGAAYQCNRVSLDENSLPPIVSTEPTEKPTKPKGTPHQTSDEEAEPTYIDVATQKGLIGLGVAGVVAGLAAWRLGVFPKRGDF